MLLNTQPQGSCTALCEQFLSCGHSELMAAAWPGPQVKQEDMHCRWMPCIVHPCSAWPSSCCAQGCCANKGLHCTAVAEGAALVWLKYNLETAGTCSEKCRKPMGANEFIFQSFCLRNFLSMIIFPYRKCTSIF